MNYKVTHITTYTYGSPVRVCHNSVLITPRDDSHLACLAHRIAIRPNPQVRSARRDRFGNSVTSFSIEENHRQLVVTASSRVNVSPRALPEAADTAKWEDVRTAVHEQEDVNWLDAFQFLYDSPRITRTEKFAEFAREAFAKERPILEAAQALTARLHKYFKYDTHATTVFTSPEEAFKLGRGVCQDFAHVEVACLKSLGLPARYVSGYLRTIPPPGKPRLVGADQTHAWVSLYCGEALGWVDFDPTNNCICSEDHIPIACGRDYSDVAPFKGVFLGGGDHSLTVSVDVVPQAEPAASAESP